MTKHDPLKPNARVLIGNIEVANDARLMVFAGPCQMESRAHALEMAAALKEIAGRLGLGLVYKTSFDKANRTSLSGKRGIGLSAALDVFAEIPLSPWFSLVLRGENLTDEEIVTRNQAGSIDLGVPRTVWGGVKLRLGR